MTAKTETIRRVWNDDRHFLEVRPWPDAPGMLMLTTAESRNAEFFGDVAVSLKPDFAEQLGRALIAAAEEARSAK